MFNFFLLSESRTVRLACKNKVERIYVSQLRFKTNFTKCPVNDKKTKFPFVPNAFESGNSFSFLRYNSNKKKEKSLALDR